MRLSTIFALFLIIAIPTVFWHLGNRLGGYRSEDIELSYQEIQLQSELRGLKAKERELTDIKRQAIVLESGVIDALMRQYESATDEAQREWYSNQIHQARERLHILSDAIVEEGRQ